MLQLHAHENAYTSISIIVPWILSAKPARKLLERRHTSILNSWMYLCRHKHIGDPDSKYRICKKEI